MTAMTAAPPLWRLAAIGAAIAAYALMSHTLMVHAPQQPWAVAVLFGPLWAAVAIGAWRRRHALMLALCTLVVAALAVVVARGGVRDIHMMYVLQHAGIHGALAWVFGTTLRAGNKPLITAMAETVHRKFTPALRTYTRELTRMWALYFVGMIFVSLLLYALAPWTWWSLYCNLLTPAAAVLLFVGEYAYRAWSHPEFERVTPAEMLRAYRRRTGAAQ